MIHGRLRFGKHFTAENDSVGETPSIAGVRLFGNRNWNIRDPGFDWHSHRQPDVCGAGAAQGFAGILFRGIICALCLLPPTILMGGTLPAVSRWLETTRIGVSRLGFLYGANIAGAVFGCLVAGFYLLRVFNVAIATYAAIAINAAVAAVAFLLARGLEFRPSRTGPALVQSQRGPAAGAASFAIGLSGLCALGAQIVWTRLSR